LENQWLEHNETSNPSEKTTKLQNTISRTVRRKRHVITKIDRLITTGFIFNSYRHMRLNSTTPIKKRLKKTPSPKLKFMTGNPP
jgi:hypothetical protein